MQLCVITGVLMTEPRYELLNGDRIIEWCRCRIKVHDYMNEEKECHVDFFQMNSFGKKAIVLSKEFRKGDGVSVVCSIRNGNYVDINGTKHYNNYLLIKEIIHGEMERKDSTDVIAKYDIKDFTYEEECIQYMKEHNFSLIDENMHEWNDMN